MEILRSCGHFQCAKSGQECAKQNHCSRVANNEEGPTTVNRVDGTEQQKPGLTGGREGNIGCRCKMQLVPSVPLMVETKETT